MDRHKLEQSLSWRRLVYMAFAAVVLLIILGGSYSLVVFRALRDQAERETMAADLALAELGSQFVADHQNGLLKRLQTVSSRKVLRQAIEQDDLSEMKTLISPMFAGSQEIESVFLANRQGALRLMVPEPSSEKGSHPGLTSVLDQLVPERVFISGVHPATRPPHHPVVTLGAVVPDSQGGILAYLGISQRVDFWREVFERFSARPGRTFHLFDHRGQVVAQGLAQALDQPPALIDLARQVRENLVHQAQSLTTIVGQPDTPGHSFAAAARVPSLDWILVVLHDYQAAMAPSRAMFGNILFFLLLLFLCLLLVGFLLLSRYRIQQRLLARVDGEARALERLVAERTADLVASTERYRSLVQDLPDMVYEMDAQGRLTFVSNASLAVLGYRPEEMIGRPRREYVVPEDRHKFDEERQRASQGEQMSNLELRHRAKDGSLRWLAIHSRGLFDREGRLVGRRGVARDMSQQVLAERRVRELSHKLINAQEEERKRVALDLHDELGQLLSALKIGLQSLAQQRSGEEAGELQRLIRLSQKIMDRIRAMAYHLRPAILDNFGLVAALEDLCESLGESGLIQVETRLQEVDEKSLSPEAKTALFRFVQESLTNAVKHSGSERALVVLEQTGDELRLTVTDQGGGFDVAAALGAGPDNKHMGLLGMDERIRLIGGDLSIQSSSQGTTLIARLPLGGKP